MAPLGRMEEVKLKIYAFLSTTVGGVSLSVWTLFQFYYLSLAAIRKADWTSCPEV